jgi:hypothetical protein
MPSKKALDAALPVARARGQVILTRPYPGSTCDFLIDTPGGIVAVCSRRSRRIQSTIDEIARQNQDTLAAISAATHTPGIIREFWLWCPYGTQRFFRVEGTTLTELDQLGTIKIPLNTGIFFPRKGPGVVKRAGKTIAGAAAGKTLVPEKNPSGPGGQKFPDTFPVNASPGKPGEREPAPVRYLRRRNAEIRRLKEQQESRVPEGPGRKSGGDTSSGRENTTPAQDTPPGGV